MLRWPNLNLIGFRDQHEGLLGGKKTVVVTARGGSYTMDFAASNFDFEESYLHRILGVYGSDRCDIHPFRLSNAVGAGWPILSFSDGAC
jgi:hypothetical protein